MPLSQAALNEIATAELRISPLALLEMKLLQEIGRLNASPDFWLAILQRDFGVRLCTLPFHRVIEASYGETWTRDPFDRILVAQAKAAGGKLISKDRRILDHFPDAIW